jgi:hypothetical protein
MCFANPIVINLRRERVSTSESSDMRTVLDAIVAAALSFLTGSSAPAAVGLAVS